MGESSVKTWIKAYYNLEQFNNKLIYKESKMAKSYIYICKKIKDNLY